MASSAPDPSLRVLIDSALDIIMVIDPTGVITFVNAAVQRVLGYRPQSVIGQRALDYVHPDDRGALEAAFARTVQGGAGQSHSGSYRIRAKTGEHRQIEALATNQLSDPAIRGISLIGRDVSVQSEIEALRSRVKSRRRLIASVARVGTWEWDPATNQLDAEDEVRQLLRQHPGQRWEGMRQFAERLVPEDRGMFEQSVRNVLGEAGEGQCMVRLTLADGSRRWLYIYARRVTDGTQPAGLVQGLVMDATRQQNLEAELGAQQQLLSLASWGADLGVWTWAPLEQRIVLDARCRALLCLPPETGGLSQAEWVARLHPDDAPGILAQEAELVAGRSDVLEYAYRVKAPDGTWRWVMDRGRVTKLDAEGRVSAITGITLSFDETMQREQRLAEQRLRLDLALEASQLGLWDWDAEGRELYANARYEEICGLAAAEVRHRADLFVQRVHPEDRPALISDLLACLAGRREALDFEGRLLTPQGKLRWVRLQGLVAKRAENGQPLRLIGTIADNSDRQYRQQLASIGEEVAGVGTFEYDVGDDRFHWSAGTYRIFGAAADFVPLEGLTGSLLASPSRARAEAAFRDAVRHGKPFDLDLEARRLDGTTLWIRQIGRAEEFEGRVVRVYGIVQDITARKALEAELLEISNREQQRLGSELHDGLGQELTGLSLLVRSLAQEVAATRPDLEEQFSQVGALLSDAIKTTRSVAHGLAPVSLDRGGLEGALQVMTAQSSTLLGTPIELQLQLGEPLRLGEVAGNHLYRIAQEAISNAVRHGHASSVQVRLAASPGEVTLEICDDGSGIPPEPERGTGLGLRSIAYRAQSLGGSSWIERRTEGGTRVRISCPQPTTSA